MKSCGALVWPSATREVQCRLFSPAVGFVQIQVQIAIKNCDCFSVARAYCIRLYVHLSLNRFQLRRAVVLCGSGVPWQAVREFQRAWNDSAQAAAAMGRTGARLGLPIPCCLWSTVAVFLMYSVICFCSSFWRVAMIRCSTHIVSVICYGWSWALLAIFRCCNLRGFLFLSFISSFFHSICLSNFLFFKSQNLVNFFFKKTFGNLVRSCFLERILNCRCSYGRFRMSHTRAPQDEQKDYVTMRYKDDLTQVSMQSDQHVASWCDTQMDSQEWTWLCRIVFYNVRQRWREAGKQKVAKSVTFWEEMIHPIEEKLRDASHY